MVNFVHQPPPIFSSCQPGTPGSHAGAVSLNSNLSMKRYTYHARGLAAVCILSAFAITRNTYEELKRGEKCAIRATATINDSIPGV